jgi:acetolactate synthase I/II/III large subunit
MVEGVRTVGEALVSMLEAYGVDTVFGIPGVHTVELYRGLAASTIRHVTPRHEQGAGFMADGYARVSGKPGVAFVITGPGLTNTITAMAQARADSVPMLVISGVNARATLGKGQGYLHELPDQRAMMATVAVLSTHVDSPEKLGPALHRAFSIFSSGRGGPIHIEIPTDVMALPLPDAVAQPVETGWPTPTPAELDKAVAIIDAASRVVILAGGGAKHAAHEVQSLAERLDAPVVTTTNGRGLMHAHPLNVPASPSLDRTRALIAEADCVVAIGTELGPTDYDMNGTGSFPIPNTFIRVDVDADQIARHGATVGLLGDSAAVAEILAGRAAQKSGDGTQRARAARDDLRMEVTELYPQEMKVLEALRHALPNAIMVGDSTQPIYCGNLFYDHDRPGGWFNAATGYGALGHGPAAAIGAQIARPDDVVVCLTGDGGFQFTLPDIAVAVDAKAPVIFLVWNNNGYGEIESSMRRVGVEPVGVSPAPPDFLLIGQAYGIAAHRLRSFDDLVPTLLEARDSRLPAIIEIGPALLR